LIKIAALDKLFSTSIYWPEEYAKHLAEKVFTSDSEGIELLSKIADFPGTPDKKGHKYYLSFASKYYHFFVKPNLPIYDDYVRRALTEKGYEITGEKIGKYSSFVDAIEKYRSKRGKNGQLFKYANVTEELFEIDRELWNRGNEIKKEEKENREGPKT